MKKKSFTLIEIVVVITVLSFVGVYFNIYLSKIYETNKIQRENNLRLIELESTKLFIRKKLNLGYEISEFKIVNKGLYFQNFLLLSNVKRFEISKTNNNHYIDILVDNISQHWLI
ncbi:MAG: type II secretion system protein [Arcobacter butzleri]|nr:type II secretion system protein [Aliarcobacter butzleri]